ncbi:hypothetical protein ABI_43150 [Asticcacaulis biprosthecium C19]|uniref:Uncharacterized protein n=1 Tax=Asticcacaulis biprosthecium C19 TaxID=715226 RepID=F4QT22_9CAUL|nr:hypothetical protein [Asticcacaulis biprosthecium]EGF89892.1 hypothetical protein ABI_43150 [Asticcacaulis biprosthecium C19]
MKLLRYIGVLAAVLLAPLPALAKTAWVSNTGDEETQNWCRYPSEAVWQADPAEDAASIAWTNGSAEVRLSSADPGGDWMVHDTYVFHGNGHAELSRIYNTFFFGEISLEEDWKFDGNRWQRTRRAMFGLSGKKPSADDGTVKNPIEKYRSLSAFPFYPLLASETVAKKICLSS